MDPKEYKIATDGLLKWNHKRDCWVLAPRLEACEDCHKMVKSTRRVVCEIYRMGTPFEHFRHTCRTCKEVLFAGNLGKRRKNSDITQPDIENAK
jgi:hypothetical protein